MNSNPDEVAAFLSRVVEARGVGNEGERPNQKGLTHRDAESSTSARKPPPRAV